jgi:hypothetical protein
LKDPVVRIALRARAELRRVAADLRLGEAEAADELAAAKGRQESLLLGLRAPLEDRELDQRDLDRERRADRRVRPADLLGHERVRDVVEAVAAVLLGHRPAEETERRHLLQDVGGEHLAPIALARARRDLLLRELARELADLFLFGGEVEVHWAESRFDRGARSA